VSAYGLCNPTLAQQLQTPVDCQVFYEHILYDLQKCPLASDPVANCPMRAEWRAVLPDPTSDEANAVLTVRLKPEAAKNEAKVKAIINKIDTALASGVPDDEYMKALQAKEPSAYAAYKGMKALAP